MNMAATECLLQMFEEHHELEDYQSGVPRWCTGCGDNAILTAVQRLCRNEDLRPEKTVFVSGIGCSSRFPHYMKTYGFHGIHGRALPFASGVSLSGNYTVSRCFGDPSLQTGGFPQIANGFTDPNNFDFDRGLCDQETRMP